MAAPNKPNEKRNTATPAADYVVPDVRMVTGTDKHFQGDHILSYRWFNAAMPAQRGSGKTVLIFNMLRWFATRKCVVYIFASTFYSDPNYEVIRNYLTKKNILYHAQTSLIDHDTGVDLAKALLEALIAEQEAEEKATNQEVLESKAKQRAVARVGFQAAPIVFDASRRNQIEQDPNDMSVWYTAAQRAKDEMKKAKKQRQKPLEKIVIIDDLGDVLRNQSITELLKRSRHFKCKIIIATQNLYDMRGESLNQLTYIFLFARMPEDRLAHVITKLGFPIDLDLFHRLYQEHTKQRFSFVLLDTIRSEIRSGLSKVIYSATHPMS